MIALHFNIYFLLLLHFVNVFRSTFEAWGKAARTANMSSLLFGLILDVFLSSGEVLEASWMLLEGPGGILEGLGGILEGLGGILEGLGGILEALGRLLGGSLRPGAKKRHSVASVR